MAHPPHGYHHPRNYSSLAQLYVRKSSSPARQGTTGGSGGSGRVGMGRYGKAIRGGLSTLPRSVNARTVGAELRRSSAAGLNVVSQRPPLPPKIELRSHSYDGLLDDSSPPGSSSSGQQRRKIGSTLAAPTAMTTEGHDRVDGVGATMGGGQEAVSKHQHQQQQLRPARKMFKEPASPGSGVGSAPVGGETIKSKNRRSRSMDDLFDDDDGQGVECDFLDNTQSMETLLGSDHHQHRQHEEPVTPTVSPPESPGATECTPELVRPLGGNICFNRRFVHDEPEVADQEDRTDEPERMHEEAQDSLITSHEQLCENETITVDSTPRLATPGHGEDDHDEDIQSTHSSVGSSHGSTASGEKGPKKAPKPLINRYVKKVKSLMKM